MKANILFVMLIIGIYTLPNNVSAQKAAAKKVLTRSQIKKKAIVSKTTKKGIPQSGTNKKKPQNPKTVHKPNKTQPIPPKNGTKIKTGDINIGNSTTQIQGSFNNSVQKNAPPSTTSKSIVRQSPVPIFKPAPNNTNILSYERQNTISKNFWEKGKKINDAFVEKMKQIVMQEVRPDATSDLFSECSNQLRDLDRTDVYPEIIADVKSKKDYYTKVAQIINGSTARYMREKVDIVADIASEALNIVSVFRKGNHFVESHHTAWLSTDEAKELKKALNDVQKKEKATIEVVKQKYKLNIVEW